MKYFKVVSIESGQGRVYNRIETELTADEVIDLLSGDPAKKATAENSLKPKVKEKSGERCPECKKPKRHAKWCSKRPSPATAAPAKKERKRPTCKNCGEEGHLQKTCQKSVTKDAGSAAVANTQSPVQKRDPLSREEFKSIKYLFHEENMMSSDIQRRLGFPIEEINFVIESSKYGMYIFNRKRK